MKKLIAGFFVTAFICSGIFANSLDFDLPLKLEVAKTQKELDYKYTGTELLKMPIPFAGPVRISYIFDEPLKNKWSFGTGVSFYIYPFEAVNASGSAIYRLFSFENGGKLELCNILDLGIFMHLTEYYNVSKAKNCFMTSFSPFGEYSLMLVYCTGGKVPFLIGLGPDLAAACDEKTIKVYYGINLDLGFKLNL